MDAIAIIGMGCLFPGAQTPQAYWQNLVAQRDCATPLSEQELGVDPLLYYDPVRGTPDKICYTTNGHVRGFGFDPHGYALPAQELERLDNLFKWTLYAADQALTDSGYRGADKNIEAGRCGLILGNIGMPTHAGKRILNKFYHAILEPYLRDLLGDNRFEFGCYWKAEHLSEFNLSTCSYNAILAAQALALRGPCYTLDAACSSALYAIKTAGYYLNSGRADLMLAGAVCHADHIYIDHGFNVLQAFPDQGVCAPFDKNSEGLKAGEGAGVVALKRLADAERDGDRIHGVIEAIGLSNDAGARHILVPDQAGQLLALQRSYAGVDAAIDYLECHATGTPVGDQVELNAIEQFFSGAEVPLLGANKGNIGHMLTASGMASILKVLLAMRHNTLPGTIKLNDMVETRNGRITLEHVVRENRPWPQRGEVKRAGINAFGFGGVNGHMVVREYVPRSAVQRTQAQRETMAITGMSVGMASTYQLDAFNQAIRDGEQWFRPLPATRWSGIETRRDILAEFGVDRIPHGAYVEKIEFDCKRFKLPPKVAGIHLLSHMALMQLAARAFYDAGYQIDGKKRNIAVIVAGDTDYSGYRYQARNEIAWQLEESLNRCGIRLDKQQRAHLESIVKDSLFPEPYAEGITGGIGNVVASRIAAVLKLDGPAFSVSSQENSVFKAMELAAFMLSFGEVEAVIVGSGSFCGSLESVLFQNRLHPFNRGKASIGFECESDGWNIGEGGGVILLKNERQARRDNDRIYASVKALAIEQHNSAADIRFHPAPAAVRQAAENCFAQAGLSAGQVGYLEAHGSGIAAEDAAELEGLCEAYGKQGGAGNPGCVVGSVKSNYGHLGAAAGIAGVIKTALCLYHRYLPGTPNWKQAKYPDLWRNSRLSVAPRSLEWALAQGQHRRTAAISSMGMDRSYVHMLLQEPEVRTTAAPPVEISEAELRQASLLKTIYIGGETPIPDMIVSAANRALLGLGKVQNKMVDSVPSAGEKVGKVASNIVSIHSARRHSSVSEGSEVGYPVRQGGSAGGENLFFREYRRNARTQLRYLQMEQRFYRRLSGLLGNLYQGVGAQRAAAVGRSAGVVFDEAQLLEMTDGQVARVLGDGYAEADRYPIRTRMPSPPYLFVSRITALTAKNGVLEPCVVEWEYDLPVDAWFVYHGLVPAFVSLESSHAMIVAFTCIGCDQLFKGELRYRAIDSRTTVYSAMPKAGETLRGKVEIKSFVRVGKNILVAYVYDCFVGERQVFRLEANSGFFPLRDIERSKGISAEKIFACAVKATPFTALLSCGKRSFTDSDVRAVQNGDLETCFGRGYGAAPVPGLCAPASKMLHRIIEVDPNGGPWGLGRIVGETDIDPEHWVFKAHFKNDPVMPGTFIVEGCEQVLKFYLYFIGLHRQVDLRPAVLENHRYSARFRGEVKCSADKLRYRLTCKKKDVQYKPDGGGIRDISLIFIAEIMYRNNVIGLCDDLGARFTAGV